MLCGAELQYLDRPRSLACASCGETIKTEATCMEGHFVCDACHARGALAVLAHLCTASTETDLLTMFQEVRSHPAFHLHGPEHHSMVPAVMVATYVNLGGEVPEGALQTAIDRGAMVPGGFCGMAGSCGAATGVGIGFSVILGATPLSAAKRQRAIGATAAAMTKIAERRAARCCLRDSYTALRSAATSSVDLLPIPLRADADIGCTQSEQNKECIRKRCPIFVPESRTGE